MGPVRHEVEALGSESHRYADPEENISPHIDLGPLIDDYGSWTLRLS